MTGDRRTGAPAVVITGVLLVLAGLLLIPATQAAVHVAFSAEFDADESIDIAQSADGAAQHPTVAEASRLAPANDQPVRRLAEMPDGWPERATAVVPIRVHNLSAHAVVGLRLHPGLAGQPEMFRRLVFGARLAGSASGEIRDGAWFAEHPEGVAVLERLEPGDAATIDVHVWLGPDSIRDDYAKKVNLDVRVTAESIGGDRLELEAR